MAATTRTSMSFSSLAADRPDLALLQHPQELDLEPQAQLADFVEKEGAPVGPPQEANFVGHGAGESALGVPNSSDSISLSGWRRS